MPAFANACFHLREIIWPSDDFEAAVVIANDIFRARFERRFHQLVFVGARREQQLPAMLEQKRDRTICAHIAAVFGKGMTHVGHGAGFVVRHAIDHHRRAADAIAFIANFFVVHALQFTGTAFDGALNRVLRHIVFIGFVHGQTQAWIGADVAAAQARGNGDFFNQARENFAALGVLAAFLCLIFAHLECPAILHLV